MLPISLITNVGSTVYVGKLWTNCSRLKQYQESRSGLLGSKCLEQLANREHKFV